MDLWPVAFIFRHIFSRKRIRMLGWVTGNTRICFTEPEKRFAVLNKHRIRTIMKYENILLYIVKKLIFILL